MVTQATLTSDIKQATTEQQPDTECYVSAMGARFSAGGDSDLLYSRLDGRAHLLARPLADLLAACHGFATLAIHAARYHATRHPPRTSIPRTATGWRQYLRLSGGRSGGQATSPVADAPAETTARLRELVELGLLVSERTLLRGCQPDREPAAPDASVGLLAVVTCRRAELLERALESYLKNRRRHGRDYAVVVFDDAREEGAAGAAREVARSVGARWGVTVGYAGAAERRRYSAQVAEASGAPAGVVEFGLLGAEGYGTTVGANRNGLLLESIGQMGLSVDDDTVCRIAVAPDGRVDDETAGVAGEEEQRLRVTSGLQDPTEFWFYGERGAALGGARWVERDVAGLHEQLLGRELRACIAAASHVEFGFHHQDPRYLGHLQLGGGRVLTTFTGLIGDCGLDGMFLPLLNTSSRARLTQAANDGSAVVSSREVMRVVDYLSINSSSWCMTTVMGFDNRTLLPPFMPIMRGEDGLFGAILWKCFGDGYVGHLPWAVAHDPSEARPPLNEAVERSAVRRNLNDILVHVMLFADTAIKGDPADRLRSLGTQLSHLGSLPLPAFEEYVRVHSWQLQAPFLTALEREVSSAAHANSAWDQKMRSYIEHFRDYLLSAEYILPQDLAEGRSVDEARELTRKFVFEYGQLLYWWPEIVAAAKRLRTQGHTLAVMA